MRGKAKRLLALLLTAAILFSALPLQVFADELAKEPPADENSALPFADVADSAWYYEAIHYVFTEGIFNGTSATEFSPGESITRAMFLTALGRFARIDTALYSGNGGFSDVDENAYYAPYVVWAAQLGIAKGVGEGRFDVDSPITREQMVVFLERFFVAQGIELEEDSDKQPPNDLDQVLDWARDSVLRFWNAGILKGDGSGSVIPGHLATRAEAASFLMGNDSSRPPAADGETGATDPTDPSDPTQPGDGSGSMLWNTGGSGRTVTITFESNGGTAIAPMKVTAGTVITELPEPVRGEDLFLAWYAEASLAESSRFPVGSVATANITLYAKYLSYGENMDEQFLPDTFALQDQTPDMQLQIETDDADLTAEQVLEALSLDLVSGGEHLLLQVTGENGLFTVLAEQGFEAGASYELHLNLDSLRFADREQHYRVCAFSIAKEEVYNVKLQEGIRYIPANEVKKSVVNGAEVDTLAIPVAVLDEGQPSEVSGSFTYTGAEALKEGDILCIYTGDKAPVMDEEYNGEEFMGEDIAYVQVTAVDDNVDGKKITYSDAQGDQVLNMPDTLPFERSALKDYTEGANGTISFTIAKVDWDIDQYADMGLTAETVVDEGDYVSIYEGESIYAAVEEDMVLGIITKVVDTDDSYTITFQKADLDQMREETDYHSETEADLYDEIPEEERKQLEEEIALQALESGFADEASLYLTALVLHSDAAEQLAEDSGFAPDELMLEVDGQQLSLQELQRSDLGLLAADKKVKVEGLKVGARIERGQRFGNNAVRCSVTISFEIKISVGSKAEMSIKCQASFIEEVLLGVNASGSAVWARKWIFWYISDYKMSATLDFKNYTSFSFDATITLDKADDDDDGKGDDDKDDDKKDNKVNVSLQLGDILTLSNSKEEDDQDEAKEGIKELFELYSELLENDTGYVKVLDKNIYTFKMSLLLGVIQIKVGIDFVIRVNLNAGIGCGFTYETGTRYCFWATIGSKDVGSSTTQLIDETFAFNFYVVGQLGIRAGVELELAVGLFSTDLNSVGFTAEVGVYLTLNGFFVYDLKIVNKKQSSTFHGAMYLELGVYFKMNFLAQVLNGKYAYNPTLVNKEWPILTAGNKSYVHDFSYDDDEEENTLLIRSTSYTLPAAALSLSQMDMKKGTVSDKALAAGNYTVTFDNPAFTAKNGVITVKPPAGIKKLDTKMTITYNSGLLTLSKLPIRRVWSLTWTTLTDTQLKEKHPVTVSVNGNTVWKGSYLYGETPTLPTAAQVLELAGYSRYNSTVNGKAVNLRYVSDYKGYSGQTAQVVTGPKDYAFHLPERSFTLTVTGVQKADGSTETRTFTAPYGGSFDLSALSATGTGSADKGYTRFLRVETWLSGKRQADTSFAGVIGNELAAQLLSTGYTYKAAYENNGVTVTYQFLAFQGTAPAKVERKYKKFDTPNFNYAAYVSGNPGLVAYSIDKAVGPVSQNTTFTVTCIPKDGYTLALHRNGGSYVQGYSAPGKYSPDAATALPTAAQILRSGFAFGGWYDNAAFTGSAVTSVAAGSHGPVQYYAKWIPSVFQLKLELDDGSFAEGTVAPTTVTSGQILLLPSKTQVLRPGYEFDGWYDNEAFAGDPVTEVSAEQTGDLTFYAKWNRASYSISLQVLPGGYVSGYTEPKSYTFGTAVALPDKASLQADHYTFGGWYDNEAFAGEPVTQVSAEQTGNVSYYAKWIPKTYKIELQLGGGSYVEGYRAPAEYTYGAITSLPNEEQVQYEDYRLLGWRPLGDNTSAPVSFISTTVSGDQTYVAVWGGAEYNVTLELDDGIYQGDYVEPGHYTSGLALPLPNSSQLKKFEHELDGWINIADQSNTLVHEIPVGTVGDVTYRAQWFNNRVPYHLDPNYEGSKVVVSTLLLESEEDVPGKISRSGYIFDGWDTKADGTGVRFRPPAGNDAPMVMVFERTDLTEDGKIVFYAQWIEWDLVKVVRSGEQDAMMSFSEALGLAAGTAGEKITIELTRDLEYQSANFTLPNGITLDGKGYGIALKGNSPGGIFNVNSGSTVVVKNITLEGATNSAIENSGELELESVYIQDCSKLSGSGGALVNWGNVRMTSSVIDSCEARTGGGIINEYGNLLIDSSSIINCATTNGGGGAIEVGYGVVVVINSTLANNTTAEIGGAVVTAGGELYLLHTTIAGNTSTNDEGGSYGGGIGVFQGSAQAYNCLIANNYVKQSGGTYALDDYSGGKAIPVDQGYNAITKLPKEFDSDQGGKFQWQGLLLSQADILVTFETKQQEDGRLLPQLDLLGNKTYGVLLSDLAMRENLISNVVIFADLTNLEEMVLYYRKTGETAIQIYPDTPADLPEQVKYFQGGLTRVGNNYGSSGTS